jgi:hypothetical protein
MLGSRRKMLSRAGFPSQLEGFDSPSPLSHFSGRNLHRSVNRGPIPLGSSVHNFRHNYTISASAILKRLAAWMAPPGWWMAAVVTSAQKLYSSSRLIVISTGPRPWADSPWVTPSSVKGCPPMARICRVLALILLLLPSSRAYAQYQHQEQIPRHVIVNGSVGLKGREVAFLNITNLQQETLTAIVSIVQPSGVVAVKTFTVAAEAMLPINIAAAFPELGSTATFSVALDIAGDSEYGYDVSAAAAMVWYKAASLPDLEQVAESKAEIRVSTKR